MSKVETVELLCDLWGFFEEAVQEAFAAAPFEATPAARRYVVGLLVDHAVPRPEAAEGERPAAVKLLEAQASPPAERFERLRTLGDELLYELGFFRERLRRRGVGEAYVVSVGSGAYLGVSAMLHVEDDVDPFRELGSKFVPVANALAEVAEGCRTRGAKTSRELLRAYERWQRNPTASAQAALARQGVVPMAGRGGLH